MIIDLRGKTSDETGPTHLKLSLSTTETVKSFTPPRHNFNNYILNPSIPSRKLEFLEHNGWWRWKSTWPVCRTLNRSVPTSLPLTSTAYKLSTVSYTTQFFPSPYFANNHCLTRYMGGWGSFGSPPQKGVVSYALSANRQNPLAGTLHAAIFNTFRRTRQQIFFWAPPLLIAYSAMSWAAERYVKIKGSWKGKIINDE